MSEISRRVEEQPTLSLRELREAGMAKSLFSFLAEVSERRGRRWLFQLCRLRRFVLLPWRIVYTMNLNWNKCFGCITKHEKHIYY